MDSSGVGELVVEGVGDPVDVGVGEPVDVGVGEPVDVGLVEVGELVLVSGVGELVLVSGVLFSGVGELVLVSGVLLSGVGEFVLGEFVLFSVVSSVGELVELMVVPSSDVPSSGDEVGAALLGLNNELKKSFIDPGDDPLGSALFELSPLEVVALLLLA